MRSQVIIKVEYGRIAAGKQGRGRGTEKDIINNYCAKANAEKDIVKNW